MPVIAYIGAAVAGAFFAAGTVAFVVTSWVVSTAVAFVTARVLGGNPNKGNNSAAGSQGGRIQVPPATNNKIPVVYGNSFVNGIITDARLITTDQKVNDTMFYCIVLSETCNNATAAYTVNNLYWNDLRLTSVNGTTGAHKILDGRKNVDNPNTAIEDFIDTNFVVDGKSLVEVRVYAGGTGAAKQIFPLQSSGNTQAAYDFWGDNDNSWTTAHEMKGLVFAIVRLNYNGEKGFTSLPNVTVQLNNSISNPADVWFDYMTSVRYGADIPAAHINTAAQTAWKNFCDEDIAYTNRAGVTNQATTRYSINGPIDTSRPVKENIDTIMQNGGAWLSYEVATGLWSPIIKKAVSAGEIGLPATFFTASRSGTTLTVSQFPAGRIEAGQLLYRSNGVLVGTITAQLAPTAGETGGQKGRYTTDISGTIASTTFYTLPSSMLAFTDDNIASGIAISGTRLDDLYNSYEAEFFDKFNKDQKAYARDAIVAGARNPNEPDNQLRLSLGLTNNSMQAAILGNLELRQSRDDLTVEFTTTHFGIQAAAGDVISITCELYDWQPKYFRIIRVREQETEQGLGAQISALEYNPDVYTVEPITEFSTSANIGIGVYGASPNLPQPPVVVINEIDTDVAIPNFLLQIRIPETGGPYDEIEIYTTEGWDPMSMTGSIVPGTGVNGAPVGRGLLTVSAIAFGAMNAGDDFVLGGTEFVVLSQITNTPASKTYVSGGAPGSRTVTLNNTTGLLIGNTLKGTGLPTAGAGIVAIAGSVVTVSVPFVLQALGTYTVSGGLGTYIVDTSATRSGTTTLFDLPIDSDYQYLKKHTPDGNNPTFTNGETVGIIITEVPANTQTYRRWFIKARMGIKKRFGRFSTPTISDRDGNFRYTPSPTGGGSLNDLSDVEIISPNEGQLLYYDATVQLWKNNSILEVNDQTTRGGITVGQGITQPMITFVTQPDGANAMYGIRGMNTQDDPWFVGGGSTGNDQGYLEIATGDNTNDDNSGGEIYVRQYNGVGVGGAPWYGGGGTIQKQLTLLDNVGNTILPGILKLNGNQIQSSTGDLTIELSGVNVIVKNNLTVQGTTASTTHTTGSVVAAGGLGVAGAIFANNGFNLTGGTVVVSSTENSTSTATGSVRTAGGLGVGLDVHAGGQVVMGGNLTVGGNQIKGNGGATAITISNTDVTIADDLIVSDTLQVNGGQITSTTAAITFAGTTVSVPSILKVATIRSGLSALELGAPGFNLTTSGLPGGPTVEIIGKLQVSDNQIYASAGGLAISLGIAGGIGLNGGITLPDDLLVEQTTRSNRYQTNTLSERSAVNIASIGTNTTLVTTTRPCLRATVSVTNGTNVQAMEVLLRRDADTAFITVYADMSDVVGGLVNLAAAMDGGNGMLLLATSVLGGTTSCVVLADAIGVALA